MFVHVINSAFAYPYSRQYIYIHIYYYMYTYTMNTFDYAFTRALLFVKLLLYVVKATFVASLTNGGTELSKTKAFMK